MNLEEKIAVIKSRLEKAQLSYGHGTDDAEDESICIILYALGIERPLAPDNNDFSSLLGSLIDILSSRHLDFLSITCKHHCHDGQALDQVDSHINQRIDQLVEKRIASRLPLAYLTNETWFAGNKFYIDQRAIIPRSYLSEWIADAFAPWIDPQKTHSILDLCTGCGCIAISCALAFPQANVLASDLSNRALEVASINIANYQLGDQVKLHHADCFAGIDQRFDLIVCNPPYVSDERMDRLPAEYRHEPESAFRGGRNGLDFIIPLLSQAENYLTDEGVLIVEAGSASHALEAHYPTIPFTWLSTAYDEMVIFTLSAGELREHAAVFSSSQ